MTVSLPYRWPRLTTCLTIRNVKAKADILVEPRRLGSTATLTDMRERNGHCDVSSVGRTQRAAVYLVASRRTSKQSRGSQHQACSAYQRPNVLRRIHAVLDATPCPCLPVGGVLPAEWNPACGDFPLMAGRGVERPAMRVTTTATRRQGSRQNAGTGEPAPRRHRHRASEGRRCSRRGSRDRRCHS